ncbi:MAG: UDP-N-acetylmuramoyl-L-alanine--D-glutamate ligase [Gemmatimonadetes bacterium]|nr:UDP-N-acetylmuramoyl-L-alanine--D-glutamate ligase [Gemmatimonadota bacterium]
MIPASWKRGEVAVIGLARSGSAVTRWLSGEGIRVYASDAADSASLRQTAAALRLPGVDLQLGGHDLGRIGRAAAVIVSPGVPPSAPPLGAAREADREILSEIDVAAQALTRTRLIAITGTNGKTTTTALIAHLLQAAGVKAVAAGNIGRPLIELASLADPPAWAAVEVSSFQLHDAPHLDPAVGVITNLAPNHLDRYASIEEYYGDKRLLFRNASDGSVWVLNGDDEVLLGLARGVKGTRRLFRRQGPADAWYDAARRQLMLDGEPLLARDRLPLLGDHNVENALAAALAARAAGVAAAEVARGLPAFRALAHRLEPVREFAGVLWFNDSKATNVSAATVAIRAMDRPFVWLAGGRHKGEPYTTLSPLLAERCRGAVVFGEAAPLLERDLARAITVERVPDLEAAVTLARQRARAGDAVLLSPACSSFDQFRDYEQRGDCFREQVNALR